MARPLRQQDYPGAVHHIFSRGVARSATAVDSVDYERALDFLERTISRFELRCHAWCYLPNHSHLLVTSQLGNLSRAMQWLGTCTAQTFNQRYERSGHLFQGRFGSKLVEDDEYFLELARYLPLNPVRAQLCRTPGEWSWSSYAATAGLCDVPDFLDDGPILELLGSKAAYVDWVGEGISACVLDEFGTPTLASLLVDGSDAAIANAHSHGYRQGAIAEHLGVSRWHVGRRLAQVAAHAQLGPGPN